MVSLELWSQDTLPEPTEQEMKAVPQEKLLEWISALPDTRRAVFNLYCLDGYSHQEIAKQLGISVNTSTSQLTRAKAILAQKIKAFANKQ